jgi:predicted nucleic acid-binding protein
MSHELRVAFDTNVLVSALLRTNTGKSRNSMCKRLRIQSWPFEKCSMKQ